MNDQTFMNAIYDILAQNPVNADEKADILELIDHVDTERNTIAFINPKSGVHFELQLVGTFAPQPYEGLTR